MRLPRVTESSARRLSERVRRNVEPRGLVERLWLLLEDADDDGDDDPNAPPPSRFLASYSSKQCCSICEGHAARARDQARAYLGQRPR